MCLWASPPSDIKLGSLLAIFDDSSATTPAETVCLAVTESAPASVS
jgi:hypothetical protein